MSDLKTPAAPKAPFTKGSGPLGTDTTGVLVAEPKGRTGASRILLGRDAIMIYALLVVVIGACLLIPRFASPVTVGFLLLDVIPILLIAMPMTLVIITGEIDLSVASTAGLTSAVIGVLWAGGGMDIGVVLLIGLLVGVVAGAFNGFLIAVVGLPSLAVTIGTLALFRGLALVVIGDNAVANFPPELTAFFTSKIGSTGIPVVMVGVLVVVLAFGVVLHLTPFGRGLYALGYSTEAASFVGIKVARSKFWLYVATGGVSALAGVFWTLRYSSARSDNASGLELAVIAAVLLGGVSIFGGKGSIPGVVAGVLLIGTINYALRLGRVSDVVLIIVTGTLLIASVVGPSIFESVKQWNHHRRIRRSLPQH
ncbi:ABC transporter permease [Plantibacter sp. VKM Ac-2885]|jgi:rhamnose transport system permease protein|uniref:Autoinducer 2 import system permease protein LsrD n=2 Tax=Plantibacter TaxID=190323 RepID=A0ABY1LMZ2_9MICO|nr:MULTISPECIES: ABC transporter permease [Plantibacter]MBD8468006.1 ABC transporter permease [Plantibacter sp. CFBP 8798]MBD8517723.1 ABC transporter permease [Plantibacter sp. CFBP 8804]MBD8535166.1 ABC transporter permease [Plantibacter sp. CFBP 13570]MBF4513432.1 ABC transporter permease [Plantibacter sp. VKM Ac-2885]MDD9153414.1 ABC transporter permease [Plantibacter flavus]